MKTIHWVTCPKCSKRGYRSRKTAKLAARQADTGIRLTAYKCDFTELWHITSNASNERRKARTPYQKWTRVYRPKNPPTI